MILEKYIRIGRTSFEHLRKASMDDKFRETLRDGLDMIYMDESTKDKSEKVQAFQEFLHDK